MKFILFASLMATMLLINACSNPKRDNTDAAESYTYSLKPVNKASNQGNLAILNGSVYNFGEIKLGEKIRHAFYIVNKGSEPIIISNAFASCGCTVAEYPKRPILPNKKDSIIAVFSSQNKGRQNKVITIVSNAINSTSLVTLIGKVD